MENNILEQKKKELADLNEKLAQLESSSEKKGEDLKRIEKSMKELEAQIAENNLGSQKKENVAENVEKQKLDNLEKTIKEGDEQKTKEEERKIYEEFVKNKEEKKVEGYKAGDVVKFDIELKPEPVKVEEVKKEIKAEVPVVEPVVPVTPVAPEVTTPEKEATHFERVNTRIKEVEKRQAELVELLQYPSNRAFVEENNELIKEKASLESELNKIKSEYKTKMGDLRAKLKEAEETARKTGNEEEVLKLETQIRELETELVERKEEPVIKKTETEEEKKVEGAVKEETKTEIKIETKTETTPITEPVLPISPEVPLETTKNMEELMQRLSKKEEEAKTKLEASPFKNKLLKATKWWENLGVEQKDKNGEITVEGSLKKRMLKMTISLALISVISMGSVEALAKAGVGTATAVGGTALIKRMGMGLLMGTAMDAGGSKIPPKIKKWIPLAVSVLGAGTAVAAFVATGGIAAGVAAGLALTSVGQGYAFTKIKGGFTEEKINEKQELAKEKMLQKFKGKDGAIDPIHLERIEEEYAKILKKYERQRVWGKPIVEVSKILAGSAIAGGMLEISGVMQDHHVTQVKAEQNAQHETSQTQHEIQRIIGQRHLDEDNGIKPPVDAQHETAHMQDIVVHKGEGIEHTFIRQIEHNPALAKELGYEGDINDTKALHEFAGREAHVIAIKEGYVENTEDGIKEIRIAEADKVSYEIKTENGHITVEEKTVSGETIGTHHEGDKFGENLSKEEYVTKDHPNNDFEHNQKPPEETQSYLEKAQVKPGEIHNLTELQRNPITGELINNQENTTPGNHSPSGEHKLELGENQVSPNLKSHTSTSNVEFAQNGYPLLSPEQAQAVTQVIKDNIHQMFPDGKSMDAWEIVKDAKGDTSPTASVFMSMKVNGTLPEYQPIVAQMHHLHEITGLDPIKEHGLTPAESPKEYFMRATNVAAATGKLEYAKFEHAEYVRPEETGTTPIPVVTKLETDLSHNTPAPDIKINNPDNDPDYITPKHTAAEHVNNDQKIKNDEVYGRPLKTPDNDHYNDKYVKPEDNRSQPHEPSIPSPEIVGAHEVSLEDLNKIVKNYPSDLNLPIKNIIEQASRNGWHPVISEVVGKTESTASFDSDSKIGTLMSSTNHTGVKNADFFYHKILDNGNVKVLRVRFYK